mmetsp:Transcript_11347/g.28712  ORF Transcript_11347/g.28712 Transcript_11347/m.28712 type:complete len:132 (-) Transcript_11347:619-1014(-)
MGHPTPYSHRALATVGARLDDMRKRAGKRCQQREEILREVAREHNRAVHAPLRANLKNPSFRGFYRAQFRTVQMPATTSSEIGGENGLHPQAASWMAGTEASSSPSIVIFMAWRWTSVLRLREALRPSLRL